MTHTETQAMCERLEAIQQRVRAATDGPWSYRPDEFDDWGYIRQPNHFVVAISRAGIACDLDDFRERRADPYEPNGQFIAHAREDIPYLLALLTRQQEEIDRLREAAKGSAVIVNVAKAEIDQRDLLLGEAKSILSLLVSDKTTSTSSQSIWAQCVSLECRIRAALQAKPETTAPISPA